MSKNEVIFFVKRQTSKPYKKNSSRLSFCIAQDTKTHTAVLNYFAAQSVSLYNYNESDKEQLCDDFVLSLWNDQY